MMFASVVNEGTHTWIELWFPSVWITLLGRTGWFMPSQIFVLKSNYTNICSLYTNCNNFKNEIQFTIIVFFLCVQHLVSCKLKKKRWEHQLLGVTLVVLCFFLAINLGTKWLNRLEKRGKPQIKRHLHLLCSAGLFSGTTQVSWDFVSYPFYRALAS